MCEAANRLLRTPGTIGRRRAARSTGESEHVPTAMHSASLSGLRCGHRLSRSMFAANTDAPLRRSATQHGGFMSYVDCYVIPVPRKNLKVYRRMSRTIGKVWRDHG